MKKDSGAGDRLEKKKVQLGLHYFDEDGMTEKLI